MSLSQEVVLHEAWFYMAVLHEADDFKLGEVNGKGGGVRLSNVRILVDNFI